jgi:hypothetical protein
MHPSGESSHPRKMRFQGVPRRRSHCEFAATRCSSPSSIDNPGPFSTRTWDPRNAAMQWISISRIESSFISFNRHNLPFIIEIRIIIRGINAQRSSNERTRIRSRITRQLKNRPSFRGEEFHTERVTISYKERLHT